MGEEERSVAYLGVFFVFSFYPPFLALFAWSFIEFVWRERFVKDREYCMS